MNQLKLSQDLFIKLNSSDIPYLHWKSNLELDHALAGGTDLDLFVKAINRNEFLNLIDTLGFIPIINEGIYRYPFMEDFLGYDRESGKFLHLHMHYRIILGEWNLKSVHLPCENWILGNSITKSNVSIPSIEKEAIILLIRIVSKGMWPPHPKKSLFLLLSSLLKRKVKNEFDELSTLLTQCKPDTLDSAITDFPAPENVKAAISSCLKKQTIQRNDKKEIMKFLRTCRWRTPLEMAQVWIAKLIKGGKRKRLIPNSASIAIVGSDGTGKTTVIEQLKKDFSWKLAIHHEYLGYNPKQMKLSSKLLSYLSLPLGVANKLLPIKPIKHLYAIRELFFERQGYKQRYSRYRRGVKKMFNGNLVFFERFPLYKTIDNSAFLLDEKMLTSTSEFDPDIRVDKKISSLIKGLGDDYREFPFPDHLIIMKNDADYLADRRPWLDENTRKTIYQKRDRVNNLLLKLSSHKNVSIVDTDIPLEQVVLKMKGLIWDIIHG
jgi:hypothetical protein